MSTLLIINGGREAIAGILRAREMGHYVVVCDGDKAAPGFAYADERLVSSTYDVESCVAVARAYNNEVRRIDDLSNCG